MKISCRMWSSVEVTYVHPPHVNVLRTPADAMIPGRFDFGLLVKRYHSATRANRGPEVIAMKNMKTDLSG